MVLRALFELAGEPPYSTVRERSELSGVSLSKATITNLLAGRGSPRPRTVRAFVDACVQLKPKKVAWPAGRHTAREWLDAYDIACGRTPTARTSAEVRARPVRVGLPPVTAEALQPRTRLTELLGSVIDEGKTAVLTQPARVLSGLGGVGKSQLAAHYAGQQWHDPATDVIVWATATSTSGIVEAYAEAAIRVLGAGTGDAEQDARRFLRWAASTPKRWLIVLDDIQTPGDLAAWRPPVTATGQTVITTRYRGDAFDRGDIELIQVDVFTQEESRAYLHQRLDAHPHLLSGNDNYNDIDPGLDGLATELGFLPLALAQATAYMVNEITSVDSYRALVLDQRRRLDELVPARDELPDGHQATVAATWSLSIQRANATAPAGLAWPLLQIASLLAPTGIPEDVFTAEAVVNYLGEALDRALDAQTIRRGLAVLHRYNLVTLDPAHPEHGVTIHSLVQRATRDADPGALPRPLDHDDLAYAVADAMCDIWPEVDTASDIGARLRTNGAALTSHSGDALWTPTAHALFLHIGNSLGEAGQANAAVAHWQNVYAAASARMGPDDINTLGIRGNLALWRASAGDPAGAAAELADLLSPVQRALGPDHYNVLSIRGHLARLQSEFGEAAGAVKLFETLVADHLRVLGNEHPDTVNARISLAVARGDAGDATGAVRELAAVLADQVRGVGPDHPHVLSTRNNLAMMRGRAGDAAGAIAELEILLEVMPKVLGPDHPKTLTTRINLAATRGKTGDSVGAVTEFENILAHQLRVLGPDHPDILFTRNNLASQRSETGNVVDTVAEFEFVAAEHLRILGPDHPRTLVAQAHVAQGRHKAGDPVDAMARLEKLLAVRLRVLGPDHPAVLSTRSDLAAARRGAGDVVAELEGRLAAQLRMLAPEHPDVLRTRADLEVARRDAVDPQDAVTEFENLLAEHLRLRGPDHHDTLTIRNNLATTRVEAGETPDITEFEDVLESMLAILGPDDPDTLTCRVNLARARGMTGDAAGAVTEHEKLLVEQFRVLGPDHAKLLTTRARLAHWRTEAGDATGAVTEYETLLAELLRLRGPDDPNTLAVRATLATMGGRPDDPGA